MFCDSSVVMPTTPPPRSPARIPCFWVKVMFVVGHGPGVPKTIPPPPPPGSGGTPGSGGGGGGGCPASGAPPEGVPPPPLPGGVPPPLPPSPPPAGATTDPGDDPPLRAHPKPIAAKNAAPYSSRPARRLPPPMPNPHTPVDAGPCSLASCAPALEMSSADGSTGCFGTRVPVPGTRVPKHRGSEYRACPQVFSTTYRPGSVESDHWERVGGRVDTASPAGYIGRP